MPNGRRGRNIHVLEVEQGPANDVELGVMLRNTGVGGNACGRNIELLVKTKKEPSIVFGR